MANNNDWDDDLDTDETLSGSELVKKLRKDLTRALKERDEANKATGDLQRKVRQNDVKSILDTVGAPNKIARFILQDVEDPTEDSVREWLTENGELFGISQDEPKGAAKPPAGMSADEAIALNEINSFALQTPSGQTSNVEEIASKLESVQSAEELDRLIGRSR